MNTPAPNIEQPTPTSIEGIHQRVLELEAKAEHAFNTVDPFIQTKWQKFNSYLYQVGAHLRVYSAASAFFSLSALAIKLWQHIA